MSDNLIEVERLTKRYNGVPVVKGISFSRPSESTSLADCVHFIGHDSGQRMPSANL